MDSVYEVLTGVGTLYIAAAGTAAPATVETTPGAGWTSLGETDGGVKITKTQNIETFTHVSLQYLSSSIWQGWQVSLLFAREYSAASSNSSPCGLGLVFSCVAGSPHQPSSALFRFAAIQGFANKHSPPTKASLLFQSIAAHTNNSTSKTHRPSQ